jgi:predicted kinase
MISLNNFILESVVISPDKFLISNGRYNWTPDNAKEAWKKSYELLQNLLQTGNYYKIICVIGIPGSGKTTWIESQPENVAIIYFDATLTNSRARRPLIEFAKKYNVEVEAVFFDVDVEVAKERNNTRSPDRKVPEETIDNMQKKLQMPSKSEGFANVRIINISRNHKDF